MRVQLHFCARIVKCPEPKALRPASSTTLHSLIAQFIFLSPLTLVFLLEVKPPYDQIFLSVGLLVG